MALDSGVTFYSSTSSSLICQVHFIDTILDPDGYVNIGHCYGLTKPSYVRSLALAGAQSRPIATYPKGVAKAA
jgi:hypothetical protein